MNPKSAIQSGVNWSDYLVFMRLPNNAHEIKIRVGQRWRKKDTKQIVEITGSRGEFYATRKLGKSRKSHGLTRKTLLLFWERI